MKVRLHEPRTLTDGSTVCVVDDCTCRGLVVATHTPGPWKVGTGWVMGPENQKGAPICTIGVSPVDDANARLIAAAPDLLAALKDIIENAVSVGEDEDLCAFCGRYGGPICDSDDCAGNSARAAIAKAEDR